MVATRHIDLRVLGAAVLFLLLAAAQPVPAAVLLIESFDSDPDWVDRDPGNMAVSHNALVGSTVNGSLEGAFASSFAPATDAFRINGTVDDGINPNPPPPTGPWVGNYNTLYPGYQQFVFDFLPEDVLPSSFSIIISDGVNTFQRNLLPQLDSGAGAWYYDLSVPLVYDSTWAIFGTSAEFSAMMSSVSYIDIQITRNTSVEQSYFIDNFRLTDDPVELNGSEAVPEPGTFALLALSVLALTALRKQLIPSGSERS
ncbi:MAG TPA: PEP-CTERM sorting domain-containing protein [Kiritimatiellia bacterium]|mgnify:CR=1 FL=1|nr:PEP-CTERM sorting domain-containing protein [Kiritimatiellia bacterium]